MKSSVTKPRIRGLYAITDAVLIPDSVFVVTVEKAILGGAQVIQYRDKSKNSGRRLRQAQALNTLCRSYRIPLIVNDDIELAASVEAAGVHLGKEDPCLANARARLGYQAIVGVSCYNHLDLALDATRQGADYVAFGSFFPSPSKPAAVHADIALLREARHALSVPIVAIGGIIPDNGRSLVEAGADGLAVISGVFGQADIRAAARAYADLFD